MGSRHQPEAGADSAEALAQMKTPIPPLHGVTGYREGENLVLTLRAFEWQALKGFDSLEEVSFIANVSGGGRTKVTFTRHSKLSGGMPEHRGSMIIDRYVPPDADHPLGGYMVRDPNSEPTPEQRRIANEADAEEGWSR